MLENLSLGYYHIFLQENTLLFSLFCEQNYYKDVFRYKRINKHVNIRNTSITDVLHNIRITTERTASQPDKTLLF